MDLDRRKFLATGLAAGGAAAAGLAGLAAVEGARGSPVPALGVDGKLVDAAAGGAEIRPLPATDPAVRRGVPGRRWVMVVDLARCNGCGGCTEACNEMHHTPGDREWLRILRMRDSDETAPYWFPKACFHCDDPPCTRVCPVDATFKREDGIVLIDAERCIGCRFCMAACPYSTRVFNWGRPPERADEEGVAYSPETGFPRRMGTVEKCDFCPELLAAGQLPPCATECSMGALFFGDENEDAVTNTKNETFRLSQLLRDRGGYRYLEELGTEPRVYYLPPVDRRYPAPGEKKDDGEAAAGGES